jgi:hypothetical protein
LLVNTVDLVMKRFCVYPIGIYIAKSRVITKGEIDELMAALKGASTMAMRKQCGGG